MGRQRIIYNQTNMGLKPVTLSMEKVRPADPFLGPGQRAKVKPCSRGKGRDSRKQVQIPGAPT
jgi:hypothetical protein